MCDISSAVSVAQLGLGLAGDASQRAENNRTRDVNRTSAIEDFNVQTREAGSNYVAKSKAVSQSSFDEALKTRAAKSYAKADAATGGVKGISVQAVFDSITAAGGRSQNRLDDEQEAIDRDYTNVLTTARTQYRSRLRANQPLNY